MLYIIKNSNFTNVDISVNKSKSTATDFVDISYCSFCVDMRIMYLVLPNIIYIFLLLAVSCINDYHSKT